MNATVLLTAVDINIPGYQILKPIGEGGMASVFLAVQKSLEREVALKVMSPLLAANAEFARRFLVEGKITAKLQHPNLVTVYDIGSHNGVYYLAAEYIPGGTLKERLAEGGLSIAEMLDITSDLAAGLDFAHQKGFVHRDVKPGNVLFRSDGRVVLADFGIAKAMDGSNSSTVAGASIGTPDYMSPEQARGEPVDGRSDLYSLGTVLFEMLAGHPPYQASDPFTVALMHVTHPVPTLPEESSWLQPLIAGLMAKQAAERYNTGAAAVEAIHALLATAPEASTLHQSSARKSAAGTRLSGTAATQQRTRVSLSKEAERRAWVLPTAIAAVLAVALGGWWIWHGPKVAEPVAQQPVGAQFEPPPVQAPDASAGANFPAHAVAEQMSADEIENALTQADNYLATGLKEESGGQHLTYPEDDSALFYFRKVLAAAPENVRAKKGEAAIVYYYARNAHRLCEMEKWAPCGLIARKGLAIAPEDALLFKINAAAEQGQGGDTPKLPPLPPPP
ncbi:MAG: serine/threonine-protein kinase [Arenimonas sp.]